MNSSPHTQFEEKHGFGHTAGIDEAGCGPWAGPVVAAAVILKRSFLSYPFVSDITDSKKLSASKRTTLVTQLKDISTLSPTPLVWAIGMASASEIDQLNIRRANFLAMTRALDTLSEKPQVILVDGTGGLKSSVPVISLIKGDQQCLSIATASLFAKVTRDTLMDQLHVEHPVYGWNQNKGYGTRMHQEALTLHGPTPYHRMSYRPVQAVTCPAK